MKKIVLSNKKSLRNAVIIFAIIGFAIYDQYKDLYPSSDNVIISKNVEVIDGDTISLSGNRIRLKGIDTPELSQICVLGTKEIQCGELAKDWVIKIVKNNTVICSNEGKDIYNRILSYCSVNGMSINYNLVRKGHALTYMNNNIILEYGELFAKADNLGIWQTKFQKPKDWRKAKNNNLR